MTFLTSAIYVEGLSEAIATIRGNPLRASLAGLAMAAAVATTAVVQTGLDGLARSARDASARAFGSDSFVVARFASGNLSRRELADKIARNPTITRATSAFSTASLAIASCTRRPRSGRPISSPAGASSRTPRSTARRRRCSTFGTSASSAGVPSPRTRR